MTLPTKRRYRAHGKVEFYVKCEFDVDDWEDGGDPQDDAWDMASDELEQAFLEGIRSGDINVSFPDVDVDEVEEVKPAEGEATAEGAS